MRISYRTESSTNYFPPTSYSCSLTKKSSRKRAMHLNLKIPRLKTKS